MYSFSYVYEKRVAQNGAGPFPIWVPFFYLSSEFPIKKYQFCVNCFKEVLNVAFLKATLSLDFFPQYTSWFLEIQMCVLFPPSKTKPITVHNLLINLSWGKLMYKLLKSYVARDLSFFFLVMTLLFSMTWATSWSTQNLLLLEKNSGLWWKFSIWEEIN